MNKKRFRKRALAVAATAVMVGSMAGCGNADSSKQAVADKQTESRTETSVTDMAGPVVDAMTSDLAAEVTDEAVTEETAEAEEPASEDADSEDSAPVEAKAENAEASNSSETRTSESRSASAPSTKAKASDSGSGSSGSTGSTNAAPSIPVSNSSTPSSQNVNSTPVSTSTGGSGSNGSSTPASSTQAPHTHTWKEHTATQQVWVSNMVTVDDYEERTVDNGYYECSCGERFDLDDRASLSEHMKTSALTAARNGVKSGCGSYLICPNYQVEKVKVGSHQEDQGHYETQTYVDYYYCDCGARK